MTCTKILVVGFLVGFALPALAAKKEPADREAQDRAAAREAKERAAKKACLNGEATKGVELLTDLYVDSNDPTYIYNQGRCYEQNDRCEDAIVRFREYLRKTAGGSASDQADVEKHITDCEALLAKKAGASAGAPAAASTAPTAGTAPPAAMPPVPGPAAVPPIAVVAVPESQGASPRGSGLRVAGLTTMAVGAAALVAGVALNLKHNSMIRDLQDDYRGGTADSTQSYKTLSLVGYGVGAACLLGGATLYWLGWRAGNAVVGPTLVAGHAGLSLTGGF